ncbi:MAG: helix-turn-helix transcriptional regulator [Rhodoferax sp.]|uniref:helix-turn-helix domain-containing protein n=1 Tax=Rhodoferax sp. TaxID=50421 RepID=UPI00260DCC3E|nr:helix-turn-helix transcriptional regulator [Rhodoferax sp.]MDD5335470.1 helix-turn-helix transcriptional regulator [Rhodoferax sp.]
MDYLLSFPGQLSQHLRSLRKARGLSQTQLAERLGVTQSRIASLEKNASSVSLDHLHKVLGALGVDLVLRETAVVESGLAQPGTSKEPAQNKGAHRGAW